MSNRFENKTEIKMGVKTLSFLALGFSVFVLAGCPAIPQLTDTAKTSSGGSSTSSGSSSSGDSTSTSTSTSQSILSITSIDPSTTQVSTPTLVTVTGTGFTSNTRITIGGASCTGIVLKSSTSIQCTVTTTSAGKNTAVATDTGGQIASTTKVFETEYPAPIIDHISPTSGSYVGGTVITVYGSNFLPRASVTVDGFTCSGAVTVSSSQITCRVPSHATPAGANTTVNVAMSNPDGQAAPATGFPNPTFTYLAGVISSPPSNLVYSPSTLRYGPNNAISITPTWTKPADLTTYFAISPPLPKGLNLNTTTGRIYADNGTKGLDANGLPLVKVSYRFQTFTITAANTVGSTTATINLVTDDWGTGADGAHTVVGTETINSYAWSTTPSVAVGATSIANITGGSGFSANQEVMIIQMQDSNATPATNPPLAWEFNTITAVSVAGANYTFTFMQGLKNAYTYATGPTTKRYQIVKIPNYTYLTIPFGTGITATAWDGNSGGIIAFRTLDQATISGTISTNGLGYRGGAAGHGDFGAGGTAGGTQGESWNGLGAVGTAQHGGGGGGALVTSAACNSHRGGGGGYGTAGGNGTISNAGLAGGTQGTKGSAFGIASLDSFLMGPGGGGSHRSCTCNSSPGQPGGGIIFATGAILSFASTALLTSSGASAVSGACAAPSGQGEGGNGAGGSIFLKFNYLAKSTGTIMASGGSSPGLGGGAGGSGRIRLDFDTITGTGSVLPGMGYHQPLP